MLRDQITFASLGGTPGNLEATYRLLPLSILIHWGWECNAHHQHVRQRKFRVFDAIKLIGEMITENGWRVFIVSGVGIFSALFFFSPHLRDWNRNADRPMAFESDAQERSEWTLRRQDYTPLEFFTSSEVLLQYKFLTKYSAIIEPAANMYLHLSDDSKYKNSNKLTFTVCSTSKDQGCPKSNDVYEFDVKTSVSSSFKVECSPFDTYEIALYETSDEETDSENENALATISAVCM